MSSVETQQDRWYHRGVPARSVALGRAKPDEVVVWVENHLESWKEMTRFIGVARGRHFDATDEDQFLELKGVIVQELELILASGQCASPTREDVHEMMNGAPSLRCVSQLNDGSLRKLEQQWHQIYLAWHASLGQLKVKHRTLESHWPPRGFLAQWWR